MSALSGATCRTYSRSRFWRGAVKDGDTVHVSVRDGELTINGWPVKAAA
jgi:hypothetical protein